MNTFDKDALLVALAPPLDAILCGQLLDEFVSMERRYFLREWEPATLDGGQFTEAASRIVYHQDSTNLNRRKAVNQCLEYVEDAENRNSHSYPERKSALHLCKVLRTIYKFRSDRGAIHIDPEYTANHIDSKLLLENTKWVLAEILRVFWTKDRAVVASTVRQLVQYDVPAIATFEGELYVQRVNCSAEEEILILLHHIGELGLSRNDIGKFAKKDKAVITRAIQKLTSNKERQVVHLPSGNFRLTDLGIKRVLTELPEKLIS
jgi:hypothetical protein